MQQIITGKVRVEEDKLCSIKNDASRSKWTLINSHVCTNTNNLQLDTPADRSEHCEDQVCSCVSQLHNPPQKQTFQPVPLSSREEADMETDVRLWASTGRWTPQFSWRGLELKPASRHNSLQAKPPPDNADLTGTGLHGTSGSISTYQAQRG